MQVKMKIIVFGASGGLGLNILEQALAKDQLVTAFVRSPSKIGIQHPNLSVFQGDVLNAEAVENAIAKHEAVISVLGPTRPPVPHMMEIAANNIIAGMQKQGVKRIVSTTGAGVRQPEDQPKFIDHLIGFLLNLLAKEVVLDSAMNVKVIQDSGLDWTIVRFPRLMDGPHLGKYRVGYVGKDSGTQISRADGADFVLKELTERKWLRQLPVVSY
jgi:putative NADH-flavin reductase